MSGMPSLSERSEFVEVAKTGAPRDKLAGQLLWSPRARMVPGNARCIGASCAGPRARGWSRVREPTGRPCRQVPARGGGRPSVGPPFQENPWSPHVRGNPTHPKTERPGRPAWPTRALTNVAETSSLAGDGDSLRHPAASSSSVSIARFEKPHSLSYQGTTFTWRPSTRVRAESKMDEAGLPVMSEETRGVFRVLQDAGEEAFGRLAVGRQDVVAGHVAGDGRVEFDDRTDRYRDADRVARQLAVELRQDQADGLGGAGRGRDDVDAGGGGRGAGCPGGSAPACRRAPSS